MRYIGGKALLTDEILKIIRDKTKDVNSVIDIFSGSGVVSMSLKKERYQVYANDFLFFSYVLSKGTLEMNEKPAFKDLKISDPIGYLNDLKLEDCFIYQNYSPNESCQRMYFQNKNAIKIDMIRQQIEAWKSCLTEQEYYYLLGALIAAVPYVSNIAGVYAAYLKHWDARTYHDLELKEPEIISAKKQSFSLNLDYLEALKRVSGDVLYADPPYNSRQYLPNYHVLETIALYDNPPIKGVTGMRDYKDQRSEFCIKSKVEQAFEKMIQTADVRYIMISYNNEGLIETDKLKSLCEKYAKKDSFQLIEIDYRRYKSKIPNNKAGLKEQIYFFEKEKVNESESIQ